jgi:hypothetical protein
VPGALDEAGVAAVTAFVQVLPSGDVGHGPGEDALVPGQEKSRVGDPAAALQIRALIA